MLNRGFFLGREEGMVYHGRLYDRMVGPMGA